ncbi:MAG: FAD-binding oxidoreductase [Desulfobacteraceae bacterium]|jgi:FAD/FMN-containing dehydrogenase
MAASDSIIEVLRDIVGPENVKNDPDILSQYAVDGMKPWVVVFPGSARELSEAVRLAARENLSLVPWGSGTKMAKGNAPSRLDMVLGTERLNRVVDMDTANLTVTAQAGVPFKELQAALAGEENRCYLPLQDPVTISDQEFCSDRENRGCFIPLMPFCSRSASLGGILAANSSGPTRLLYGLPRDIVLGVRYVAPNGEIIGMGGKTVKNVSGYDMSKLMIGSLGSLGILCEMTLRLLPLPERAATSLFLFEGLSEACRFVDKVFGTNLLPAAVELINHRAFGFVAPEKAEKLEKSGYMVAVAVEGVKEAVERMILELEALGRKSGAGESMGLEKQDHHRFWDAYSNLPKLLFDQNADLVSVKLNYPVSRYAEVTDFAESSASEYSLDSALLSHAGSGVTFIHYLVSPEQANATDRMAAFINRLLERCGHVGGNMIVERASPDLKQKLPVWGSPRQDLVLMKRLKERIDPAGLFSPGRFVGGI